MPPKDFPKNFHPLGNRMSPNPGWRILVGSLFCITGMVGLKSNIRVNLVDENLDLSEKEQNIFETLSWCSLLDAYKHVFLETTLKI